MNRIPNLSFSISATTRSPRPNEQRGVDYYFLNKEDFERGKDRDEFLEWEEVYEGVRYGTLRSEVERIWDAGHHVVFDVDVKGGVNIKRKLGDQALSIFIKVNSPDVLRQRLLLRNTETSETLDKRVQKSFQEMAFEGQFEQVVINDNFETAVDQTEVLVRNFIGADS